MLAVRVIVNFQLYKSWTIHTMAEDCRTALGPFKTVSSEATMLRLFRYLGATPEAMDHATRCLQMWARGGVHIDVPDDRLYLLGVKPHAEMSSGTISNKSSGSQPSDGKSTMRKP